MKDWMFFEERQKAKEIIIKLNLKEKIALLDELYTDIKDSGIRFGHDIEKEEWNKMVERSGKGNMLEDIIEMRYERNKDKIKEILNSLTTEEKFALHDYLDLEERIEDVKLYMEYEYEELLCCEDLIKSIAKRTMYRDDSNECLNDQIESAIEAELRERNEMYERRK